jgi:hypothetical protein
LGNYCDLIEAQLHSNWGLIATPLLFLKSLVVDYQQVTSTLIFAIFTTTGNFARVEANYDVKKRQHHCSILQIFYLIKFEV